MDLLTSGFRSSERHPDVLGALAALKNARLVGLDLSSSRRLAAAVADCLDYEIENKGANGYLEPPYEISSNPPYRFRRRVSASDPVIKAMRDYLDRAIPFRRQQRETADPTRPSRIITDLDRAQSIDIDTSGISHNLPVRPTHDLARSPRGTISLSYQDLIALARDLDKQDNKKSENHPGNWEARLLQVSSGKRKFDILKPGAKGLEATDQISLSGLQHMIGLPGAGKTTLVQLILIWLDRNDYRAAVMLPSIEASLNMISVLERYSASVGLLVGQSSDTKRGHANKLAERIASMDDRAGFGTSGPGAGLMAYNCVLDGFRDGTHQDHIEFNHNRPPCSDLKQRKTRKNGTPHQNETDMLCPVSGWCGRMKAPRELTEKRIWIGHILSAMPRVMPHFVQDGELLRYVDLISRTMDLVVIDEADGAQNTLDSQSVTALKLTGDEGSLEDQLNRDVLLPFARGQNSTIASNFANYHGAIGRFSQFNLNLVRLLQTDRREGTHDNVLTQTYPGRFVTGATVIGELYNPENLSKLSDAQRSNLERRLDAIGRWWDDICEAANRDESGAERSFEHDLTAIANASGKTQDVARETSYKLKDLLRYWTATSRVPEKQAHIDHIRETLFNFLPYAAHLPAAHARAHLEMLVGITTVIMQYNVITLAQQAMVAEGVHERPLDGGRPPLDIARLLPESLVGRLAGVKISFSTKDERTDALTLEYMNFRSVPRLLLYHWHHLNAHENTAGPNVLLTSATSFLEESPSYHIPIGPDYVLKRTDTQTEWKDSIFKFMPINHPIEPGKHLRFSGAKGGPEARQEIIENMIDHYYSGDYPRVTEMTQDFAPSRRVAFVVNSYEQVRWIKDHLYARYPHIAKRTIGVTNQIPNGNSGDWVVASQVETIGRRDDWDAIVFPMRALSRGVNIVFPAGPNKNDAVLGTVIFLTRPHPSSDSFEFVTGMIGRKSMEFDLDTNLASLPSINDVAARWREERVEASHLTSRLLRTSVTMSRLGNLSEPFVADIMVEILQTIGRAMRNGVKCRAIFVDAAWAPNSAAGGTDTRTTSMLVSIMKILEHRLTTGSAVEQEVYRAMYEPFLLPLKKCAGLNLK